MATLCKKETMEEKLSGIVLGGVNFGENDKILTIFTLEQGVISARIKGVKKAGAKLKFASEPFCFASFIVAKKGKMRTVTGASLIESFYPIREDLTRYFAGGTVLEYLKKFLQEGIVSADAFRLAVDTLKEIAYGDAPKYYLCDFLIKSLAFSGYALTLEGCYGCGCPCEDRVFFDYAYGGFFCLECMTDGAKEINTDTYKALKSIKEGVLVSEENCTKPLRLLDYYLTKKTEVTINSLKELNKLFERA